MDATILLPVADAGDVTPIDGEFFLTANRAVYVSAALAAGVIESARLVKHEWDDCYQITHTESLEDVALDAIVDEAQLAYEMTRDELPIGEGYAVQVYVAGQWQEVSVVYDYDTSLTALDDETPARGSN
jgi:hypothetical protein